MRGQDSGTFVPEAGKASEEWPGAEACVLGTKQPWAETSRRGSAPGFSGFCGLDGSSGAPGGAGVAQGERPSAEQGRWGAWGLSLVWEPRGPQAGQRPDPHISLCKVTLSSAAEQKAQ